MHDAATLRLVRLLAAAAFASSASMRVCDPLLPALAAEFGASLAAAAAVNAGFAIAYGVLQLAIGPLADRAGKARVVRAATGLAAVASLACAAAPGLDWLVLARVVAGGVGGAIIPVAFAWIGDEIPYDVRQGVLARVMSGGLLGLVCGQLIGGVLVDAVGWRWAFVVLAALFAVVAVRLVASGTARPMPGPAARGDPDAPDRFGDAGARGDAPPPGAPAESPVPIHPLALLRDYADIARPRWSRVVLACVMLEALLMYGAVSFVPSALHARFGIALWQAALVSATVGVGGFVYTLLAARLIAGLGERRLSASGGALAAAGLLLLAASSAPWMSVAACLALGLGFYGFHNTLQVHGTQLSSSRRGMGTALFALAMFVGQSAGVALGSVAVAFAGFEPAFAASGVAFALLTVGFAGALARRAAAGARH